MGQLSPLGRNKSALTANRSPLGVKRPHLRHHKSKAIDPSETLGAPYRAVASEFIRSGKCDVRDTHWEKIQIRWVFWHPVVDRFPLPWSI